MPELLTVVFLTTKMSAALEITPNYLVHAFVGCQSELGSAEWFLVLAGLTSYIHGQSLDLLGLAGVGRPHLSWHVSLYSLWSLIIQQTGPSLFTQQGHGSKEVSGSMQRLLKSRL